MDAISKSKSYIEHQTPHTHTYTLCVCVCVCVFVFSLSPNKRPDSTTVQSPSVGFSSCLFVDMH
jgi:hypothetical protein